jgi:hypothetical protein
LQYLHPRLLDQAIQHRRDAKLSHPAVRLRDFHPSYRLWLVGPAQQWFPYGWPVLLQIVRRSPTVMPSIPGLPLFALTRLYACQQFRRSQTSSINCS